jgi:glycosyltransferase involved in cell wall biosynthesis
MTTKVFTVIPCYNEENAIGRIVAEAIQHSDKVIVVDNNSTDSTSSISEQFGAEVIRCKTPGVGAATRAGICSIL